METGTVTSVRYKDGVPVCRVQIQDRVDNEDPNVPVMRMHHGMFMVPQENQKVQMLKLGEQRFVVGVLAKGEDYSNPDLSEGDLAFMLDDQTKLSFTQRDDGAFDVNVKASGKVYIEGIPFEDHVHELEDATIEDTGDGSGTKSTTTKQTTTPQ